MSLKAASVIYTLHLCWILADVYNFLAKIIRTSILWNYICTHETSNTRDNFFYHLEIFVSSSFSLLNKCILQCVSPPWKWNLHLHVCNSLAIKIHVFSLCLFLYLCILQCVSPLSMIIMLCTDQCRREACIQCKVQIWDYPVRRDQCFHPRLVWAVRRWVEALPDR